jgi:hypothetical protein
MKSLTRNQRKLKNLFFGSLMLLLILSPPGFSQEFNDNIDIPDYAKVNFLNGISSDNQGLKSSSIYYVGRYRLGEANGILLDELKKSKEENLSLLIAWSIYRIGDEGCVEELKKIAGNHTSKRLKTFCAHLDQQKKFELAFEKSKQS